MRRFLSKEQAELGTSLAIGEQIHVNHEGCEAGEDRKKRLYIKRTNDGTILYYCHHCGKSRTIRNSVSKTKRLAGTPKAAVRDWKSKRSVTTPADSESDPGKWPANARVWFYRYGITDAEIKRHGFLYSERLRRVVLPIYNNGELVSYQTRRVFNDDERPKYLSYGNKDSVFHVEHSDAKRLCIVEDLLSSIKVGRYINTLALRKTSLSDKELRWILEKGYNDFIIFLDDDNAQVKKQQLVLKNKLENFGKVTIIHSGGRDPKEYDDLELKVCISKRKEKDNE